MGAVRLPRPPGMRAVRELTRAAADWLLFLFWVLVALAVAWTIAVLATA